jgi:Na+/H+-dicarboxylate symporter
MESVLDNFKFFQALTFLSPGSLKNLSSRISVLVETKLWAKVLSGMILGILLGVMVSEEGPLVSWFGFKETMIDALLNWLALPAKFFLKLIQMVIIPLIIASVIRGLASTTDVAQMKSLGLRYGIFVIASSGIASLVGLFWGAVIKPGAGLFLKGAANVEDVGSSGSEVFVFQPESLVNVLPTNPLASIVEGQMLDVVVLSIIAGVALISIDHKQSKSIMDLLEVVQEVCMTVISWAMRLAPLAVFGMMAQVAGTTGPKALQSMGLYVVAAFVGFTSFVLIYSLLVGLSGKLSPLKFLKKLITPGLLAFSTSSSAATMPLTMKVAEEELEVEPSVARFLIPLGTTVNMAGSTIWHTTAVVFLSQAYDINLSLAQISLVVATSIGSAIGSPGVPGVGIGVLSAVLIKVGIPIEGVGLIMGVERLVDMGCTVVNVTGDLAGAVIFGRKKIN